MNAIDKNLPPERISAIQSDLRAIPDTPVGPHLTVDQNLAYVKTSLAREAMAELDRHVASCLGCAANLERWITLVDLFTKLFQSVRDRLEFWRRPSPQWAFGFSTKQEVEIAGPDRLAGLYMVENEGGDLELRVGSRHLECAGCTLRLRVGDWYRDLQLTQVDEEEVGAKTIITRADREKFPEGAVPEVELLP